MDDVTIILQGYLDSHQIQKWIHNYSNWNVIISTWCNRQGESPEINISKLPPKWSFLMVPLPKKTVDIGNLQYQIQSTQNAFQHVNTEYIIKARGDEYYSNLHRFVREMKYKKDQIICSDIFYRGYQGNYFHISDHLIGGTSENIKIMFENSWEQIKDGWKMTPDFAGSGNPETYLGFGFVSHKENITKEQHQSYLSKEMSEPLFEKWFDSYDLEKIAPYVVKAQGKQFSKKYECQYNF